MTKRSAAFAALLIVACLGLPLVAGTPSVAQETRTIRVATLAPRGSSWMRVFDAWNGTLQKETDGRLELRFYPGGVAGDEKDFVRKMRAGQMDAAAVTTTGLGLVVRPVLVLAAPGVLPTYQALDRARKELDDEIEAQFMEHGYKLLGWGDVGRVRLFSNAQPIRRPSDLRQVRPWAWRDEVVLTSLLDAAGANPVRLGVPEVYPALQTGMIDTVFSTGVAAVSLQWYTRLDYVTRESRGVAVGATILKRGVYEELPTELREALDRTADKAHAALRSAIRRDDERAYRVMTERGMREVSVTEFEDEWEALERKVRERLTGRLFPASLLERVARAGRGGNPAGG